MKKHYFIGILICLLPFFTKAQYAGQKSWKTAGVGIGQSHCLTDNCSFDSKNNNAYSPSICLGLFYEYGDYSSYGVLMNLRTYGFDKTNLSTNELTKYRAFNINLSYQFNLHLLSDKVYLFGGVALGFIPAIGEISTYNNGVETSILSWFSFSSEFMPVQATLYGGITFFHLVSLRYDYYPVNLFDQYIYDASTVPWFTTLYDKTNRAKATLGIFSINISQKFDSKTFL